MSIEQLNKSIDNIVINSEKIKGKLVPTGHVQQDGQGLFYVLHNVKDKMKRSAEDTNTHKAPYM